MCTLGHGAISEPQSSMGEMGITVTYHAELYVTHSRNTKIRYFKIFLALKEFVKRFSAVCNPVITCHVRDCAPACPWSMPELDIFGLVVGLLLLGARLE